jgi:hypothetical protein
MNHSESDKYALQKVEIRNNIPLDEAEKHYKKITKRKPRKVRETTNFYQFRFLPPTKFESRSFRTKVVNDDIRLIFGKLKESHHHLEGSGLFDYFTKAYDYVKNKVSDAFDYVKNAVSINDFSDKTKKNLSLYGEYPIIALQIRRVPIAFALDLALQGISAGEWERLKDKYGFDKFYHLSMVATLKGAKEIVLNKGKRIRQNKQLAIEKLEVVSVNENIEIGEGMETQDVIIPKDKVFNIKDMFQKARDRVGDTKFFSYSALGQNNCQDFIGLLLDVEGLYNEPEKQFVYQDISALSKELPQSTVAISQGITHLGALANKYLGIGGSRATLHSLYRDSITGGNAVIIPKKEFVKEHKHLIELLNKSDIPELKKEATIQAKELELKGGAIPLNKKIYEKAKSIVYPKYKKASAYRSGAVVKLYKEMGGKFKDRGDKKLSRWFKEEWKDVGDQEYPVFRPTKRITKDTPLTVDEIDPKNLKEQINKKQEIKGEHNLKPFKEKKVGGSEYQSDSDTESSDSDSDTDIDLLGAGIPDSAIIKINYTKKPKSYQKITIHTRTPAQMREFMNKLKQIGRKLKVDINDSHIELGYIPEPEDVLKGMDWYEMPEYEVNPLFFKCPYIQLQVEKTKKAEPLLTELGLTDSSLFLWFPNRPKELSDEAGKVYITKDKITPKYPIYIISVGRWEKRHTSKYLEKSGIDYKIVVEPAQAEEYKKVIDPKKVLVLPQNYSKKNVGGIPARNFVWNHSKKEGHAKHWILDDNIDGYERFNRGERTKCYSGVVFRCIEDYVDRYANIKMAGHNYHMFGSSKRLKPIIKNTRIYSSILLSNDLPFEWRGRYNEDTDLSLRILKSGYATALFNNMLANKLTTMTQKGGNTDTIYGVKNAHFLKADSLRKQHPDVATVKKRFNRIHHYVDYSGFKDIQYEFKKGVEAKLKHKNNNYTMTLIDKDKFFKEELTGGNKDEYVIAIPSYNRPEILKEESLKTLKRQQVPDHKIYIFVVAEEEEEYKRIIGEDYKIIVGKKGYANQLDFIIHYFPEDTPLVIFHDDIKSVFKKTGGKDSHSSKEVNLDNFIRIAFKIAKDNHLNLWGVNKVSNPFMMTEGHTTDLRLIEGNFYGMFNKQEPSYKNTLQDNYTAEDIERSIIFYKNDGGVLRFNDVGKDSPTVLRKGGIETDLGSIKKRIKMAIQSNKELAKKYKDYGELKDNHKQGKVFNLKRNPHGDNKLTEDEAITQFYEYMKSHKGEYDIKNCFKKWKEDHDINLKITNI